MKKPFQVGDRVAVYGHERGKLRQCGTVEGMKGEEPISFPDTIKVRIHPGCALYCHPKQCRRLVKKPRRRVWIEESELGKSNHDVWVQFDAGQLQVRAGEKLVEFIEVRRK
jgi:hypothetical protein